jgi:hypothetical protein
MIRRGTPRVRPYDVAAVGTATSSDGIAEGIAEGIACDPTNGRIVGGPGADLEAFATARRHVTVFSDPEPSDPDMVAVNTLSGAVTERREGLVAECTADGAFITPSGSRGQGPRQPQDPRAIAVAPASGGVFVVDGPDGRVARFPASGSPLGSWPVGASPRTPRTSTSSAGRRAKAHLIPPEGDPTAREPDSFASLSGRRACAGQQDQRPITRPRRAPAVRSPDPPIRCGATACTPGW